MLPCVCSVIDHRWRQNVVRTKKWHRRRSRVCHWLPKTPLISALRAYISKTAQWNFFLHNFDEQSHLEFLEHLRHKRSRKMHGWNIGCFPFTKRFRKFRLGCKWNMIFRFVPLENFRKKWNFWKGSPVFPLEIFRWNCVFHLRVSQRFTSSRPHTTISSARKYGGYSFS